MDFLVYFLLIISMLIVMISHTKTTIKLDKIIDSIENRNIKLDDKYDEYNVKCFTLYTTFRVVPYTRIDGVVVYDVQYRNPADTQWKVCRCEDTENEAYDEMKCIIEKIESGTYDRQE